MFKNTLLSILFLSFTHLLSAQTSWIGGVSTNWKTASNWTAGVPTSTIDAIIGDANFTGPFQPVLTGATANCRALTIGTGSILSTLSIDKNINFFGNVLIGSNGSILHSTNNRNITLKGNWTNQGIYSATGNNVSVIFSGAAQTLTGTTTFKGLTVNTGSTVTLASNITVNNSFSVSGTFDASTFTVSGTATLTVNAAGTLLVKGATFAANYATTGTVTLNATSTVNYASAAINQNISPSYTYGYLRVSGGLIKYLTANLLPLNSTTSLSGRVYVDAGTLDMQTFTANRGTTVGGGNFIIAIGSTLKIGGTNSFPANYATVTIASNSTVVYYGNNQTVVAYSYGHLIFESTSGAAIKTMPVTAMTIAGSFTSQVGTGTGVTFTAGNSLTVNQNVSLDAASTFNASTFAHTFKTNWTNNGTFNGNTSTVSFTGANAVLSGTGSNNFFNLTFTGAGITAAGTTNLNVSGNLATSGSGAFEHSSSGTVTLSGASKTISGSGFKLFNCSITGSISTSASFFVSGDFTVNGTFTASASSIITLNGSAKTIAGTGSITFYSLNTLGTISTAINFTMLRDLTVAVSGSLTATNGIVTFNGTSTLAGTANLYNVVVNATMTLNMGTNAVLGIANVFTINGTFNVTTNTPNTVTYNSATAQTITNTAYNNLVLANGGTKTPAGNLTVNNDFTINAGVTFNAASFTFSLYRHFTNNGTFTAGTSSFQLRGSNAATLSGSTTFNELTENKTAASISVTLASNMIASSITMTAGNMRTGANSITATSTRTGAGIIIGTIIHAHSFVSGTPYYFEGPQNSVTFTSPSAALTSVSVTVIPGTVLDFDPAIECVNREYQISIPSGTYTDATLSYHYEDNELNAFAEPFLAIYKHNSGILWDSLGVTTRNSVSDYVTLAGITNLPGRYSASGLRNIVRWNGSVSTAWENAANWTTISGASMVNRVPNSTDAAEIGQIAFTNQPVINSAQQIGLMKLGSVQPVTVTIATGSLDNLGSIRGIWSAAASHTIDVGAGTLSMGTSLLLSDGIAGHDITLLIGSGSANITNTLSQSGGAVVFSGNGILSLSGDYTYSAGTFTCGSGTVIYTGAEAQTVAPLVYNNLSFTKPTDAASTNAAIVVNGNLTTSTGGEIVLGGTLTVAGNITIGANTNLVENGVVINVAGNWTNNGLFTLNSGTVNFNGSAAQSVNANTFNNVIVNKPAGTLTLTGNVVINSDLALTAGALDLSTLNANRSNNGGTLTLGAGTLLKVGGANNFPQNFVIRNMDVTSTVEYHGTIAQTVTDAVYGNLTFTSGGATPKTFVNNTTVNGNLLINAGATMDPNFITISLNGNLVNSGTYTPSGSTLHLTGLTKSITGSTTFYTLLVTGSYTVVSGMSTLSGDLFIATGGSLNLGSNNASLDGDLTVNGSLTSNGTATFTGTRVQTLQVLNAIVSSSTGVINFNGTVAPVFNSNTSPTFATLNINNTAGISPSVPWTVYFACNIAAGASFNGGALIHTFFGNFINNGTVTSSGELRFTPSPPFSSGASVKLDGVSFISTGKVVFGGTSPMTITNVNPSFNLVSITNTNVAGVTPPSSWTIGNELFIGNAATFNCGAGFSHSLGANLTNNGTLNGQTSTVTFTGNPAEINGLGTTNFYNLTVAATADLTLNRAINISKDFVANGVFIATGRTVVFNGSTSSIISGLAGTVTFDDLEQNKTAGTTTLSIPITVTGDLMMTSGIMNTTAVNLLTLSDAAISTPGNSTSFVDGPMKKIGNDTFTFPLGDGTIWARLAIEAPASVTDAFTAQYFAVAYSNTTSMAASPTPVLNNVSSLEYWTCSRTTGTSNVKVKLYWENAARSVIQNYTPDLVVARWNGSAWANAGQSAINASSPGDLTSDIISSFTTFTFGSLSGASPLPIELLSFTAVVNETQQVELNWVTASETNNDYFTVEKTSDGINYEVVAVVDGAGTGTQMLHYKAIDQNPYYGVSYYRLKQTDFNGIYSYSPLVAVTIETNVAFSISIYPNPGNGISTNIVLIAAEGQEIPVYITDVLGKECYYNNIKATQKGTGTYEINFPEELSPGVYFLSAIYGDKVFSQKIIIE